MPPDVIWLSNLNFADLKPSSRADSGRTQAARYAPDTPNTLSASHPLFSQPPIATGHLPFNPNHKEAHIRMAGDILGEELAPDATIWKLYVEEAVAQDNELVNSQNRSLDLMLLFATLFSAILTAFLIEAKDMLQADPAEVSAALLLQILQSQYRIETGTPSNNSTLVENPSFTPTSIARWINGLWFTALALSLAAALVAMLAKEWLADFVATTVRPPFEYALQRQARYNGLVSWGALHITALLPTLLHLSLLFFALGLILLLWELDKAVALVFVAVVSLTVVFYVSTALLGAIFESCPFVTQISKYVHRAWVVCLGTRYILKNKLGSAKLLHDDSTPDNVLQALGWLARNSRDRAVADCAYQALAAHTGTSNSHMQDNALKSTTTVDSTRSSKTRPKYPLSDSAKATNIQFLHAICRRFSETLVQNHREVATCEGANIARYAAALPKLVEHVEAIAQEQSVDGTARMMSPISSPHGWTPNQYDAVMLAFGTLDTAWGSDCPPLSADSYAILTAAELKLAVVVAKLGAPSNNGITRLTTHPQSVSNVNHTIINFSSASGIHSNLSHARDGRAFARASVLIHYHVTGQISMGTSSLVHLLNSISVAANCEDLNSDSVIEFRVNVVGRSSERCPSMDVLGDPNGIFRRVLVLWQSEYMPGTWTKLDLAAAEAVGSFAQAFLKQWVGRKEIHGAQSRSRSSSYRGIDFELPITAQTKEDKDMFLEALNPDILALQFNRTSPNWILGRILAICNITLIQIERQPNCVEMLEQILWALFHAAAAFMRYQPRQTYVAISRHATLIRRLVGLVADSSEVISSHRHNSPAASYLISFLSLSFERKTVMFYSGIPPQNLLKLLQIIARTPNHPAEVEYLLSDTVQLVEDRTKDRLRVFSSTGEGFALLVAIGQHNEYLPLAANAIQSIIRDPRITEDDYLPRSKGVSEFLDAASFVLSFTNADEVVLPSEMFAERVLLVLQLASKKAHLTLPSRHPAFSQLLSHFENEPPRRGGVSLTIIRKLTGWDFMDLADLAASFDFLYRLDDS